ncbi:MAG: hypothetical protein U0Z53_25315 [Blastocatellia bacterium]
MQNSQLKTAIPENHSERSHALAATIASLKKQWQTLSNEPLVFMLLVWALLFALAAFINLHT